LVPHLKPDGRCAVEATAVKAVLRNSYQATSSEHYTTRGKNMGRNDGLITANEAAELLGMTTPNFNCLVKDGYFSPIYPNGRIRGRLFREEEVLEYKKGRLRVSPIAGRIKSTNAQYLAEKAMLLAKQVSVRLDEFCSFLGMDGCRLELNEEGLRRFFKVQGMLDQSYYTVEPKEVFELAKLVQSVDEPYLKFIYKALGQ